MSINEKLKFSWGHIIAFVALIVISYFSFLGLTYLTDGNFIFTGIGVTVIVLLLASVFIGAQVAKGTDHKFKKTIILERVLVAIAPLVLIAMMYPVCHFWTVFGNREDIEKAFQTSVESAKGVFTDYDNYSQKRCDDYSQIVNSGRGTLLNKQDRILALDLQLRDENFTTLRDEAESWIDKAKGATVWNAFMIANIKTIKEAIINWHTQLVAFSSKKMSEESSEVPDFDADSSSLNNIVADVDRIKEKYDIKGHLSVWAIIMVIFCYIFLMFPYVIQQRNTRSQYHLFYNEGNKSGIRMTLDDKPAKAKANKVHDDDDFGSFTM